MLTHAADLAIQPLDQRDAEDKRRFFLHFALFGHRAQHRHACAHSGNKLIGDRLVDRNDILFFVVVTGPQDLVDQITVVGKENQALRIFVESANREDALAVIDEIADVIALALFHGGDNPHRLIQGNQHQIVFIARLDKLTIDLHHIACKYLRAHSGAFAVNENVALLDVTIGVTTGADAALADVFIKTS